MARTAEQRRVDRIEDAIQKDEWKKARALIRDWLREDPKDHWLLSRLALTYYEQHQYKKAIHFEVKALQIEPYCPWSVWGYASALEMLGEASKASMVFRWLVSWGEDYLAEDPCVGGVRLARSLIADCHYRIAGILVEMHQWKRAKTAFEQHFALRRKGAHSTYPLKEVQREYKKLLAR